MLPRDLGFYQDLPVDMQNYLSNSADIQRTSPVAGGTGAWGHGVEVGFAEACKIQWFCESECTEASENSQDPACRRREGCALARAPERSAIAWALLRRSLRYRPS